MHLLNVSIYEFVLATISVCTYNLTITHSLISFFFFLFLNYKYIYMYVCALYIYIIYVLRDNRSVTPRTNLLFYLVFWQCYSFTSEMKQ